ncbi:MAG: hypothetical protein HKM93_21330 [Desulfobacteraceae bacterium]|nr:hypothetical protein [Desulfobacteraceae bacterium]
MSQNLVIILGGCFFLLLTWAAILDVARKDFGEFHFKVMWGFIAFIPFIGWLIYLIFGFKKGQVPSKADPATEPSPPVDGR